MIGSYLISAVAYSVLSIPQIGLRETVYHCPSAIVPAIDRCLRQSTVVKQGHFPVLLGHSYTKFNDIKKLKRGDKFRYNHKVYEIYDIRIVTPKDIWILNRSENEIVLQTCQDGIARRYVIFARDAKQQTRKRPAQVDG